MGTVNTHRNKETKNGICFLIKFSTIFVIFPLYVVTDSVRTKIQEGYCGGGIATGSVSSARLEEREVSDVQVLQVEDCGSGLVTSSLKSSEYSYASQTQARRKGVGLYKVEIHSITSTDVKEQEQQLGIKSVTSVL
jgi:hypothetical protein